MATVIIAGWETYRYQLRLNRPLVLRGETFMLRAGLLIKLISDSGNAAWGEIAPLPGFSRESFDEVIYAVKRSRYRLLNRTVPDNLEELSGGFDRWLHDSPMPPSVQCGFEAAVLTLLAAEANVSPAHLMSHTPLASVAVNGLISATSETLETELKRVVGANYQAVKLKVGRDAIEADIATVRRVREALPANIQLRLDANRAWEYDDAMRFAEGIAGTELAYLEEPLADSDQLPTFAGESGLPLALDESLRDLTPEELTPFDGLKAIIVRPMLLGGFERSMRFARRAHQFGMCAVISSAVESVVGLGALVSLAAAMNSVDIPVGLDTLSWFDEQPVTPFVLEQVNSLPVTPLAALSQRVELARIARINHD